MARSFLPQLHALLEHVSKQEHAVVEWADDGKAFFVHDAAALEAGLLPRFFSFKTYSTMKTYARDFGFRIIGKQFLAPPYFYRGVNLRLLPFVSKRGGLRRNSTYSEFDSVHGARRVADVLKTEINAVQSTLQSVRAELDSAAQVLQDVVKAQAVQRQSMDARRRDERVADTQETIDELDALWDHLGFAPLSPFFEDTDV